MLDLWGLVGVAAAAAAVTLYFFFGLVITDCDLTLRARQHIPADGFEGRVVWITGASSGIGRELAIELAKRKATLVLSARRKDELEVVAARCVSAGSPNVRVLVMDAVDLASHKALVASVLAEHSRIDVLVNNAGCSQRSLVEDSDVAVDRELLLLNVLSPISLTKAVLPSMIAAKRGHIVITSSVAGKMGAPCAATYSASKHACQGFFDTLRMEVADRGITVTSACPGPVVSQILNNAFTGSAGPRLGLQVKNVSSYMATSRCSFLMACAIYHELDEVWIAKNPILLFVYVSQYVPSLYKRLGKLVGPKRVANFRAGIMDHDFSEKKKTQ